MRVRKAVFPAAGLGTRFLPATKAQPKEMLSVVDKPIIQYGVEEALAAGCDQIIFVTGRGKSTMEDHFDVSYELEKTLEERGKTALLAEARRLGRMVRISSVRQKEALGLGHAVLMARELVGDEPFAVILPDDLVDAPVPCLKQLIDVYDEMGASVLATMAVDGPAISAYGCLDARPVGGKWMDRLFEIQEMVEKPKFEQAPSNLAIIGRYVLSPKIFELLEKTPKGAVGELQLTDGMRALLKYEKFYGYRFEGTRYDAGDKLGFLKATVELGLKHPELGKKFAEYLRTVKIPG